MKNGLKIICYSQFLQPTYFCCGTTWRASSSRTFQEICHHRYQTQFATVSSLMPPQVASGRYCLERWFNYEIFAAPRRRWALGPGGARGALCACSGSRDSVIIERKENATPSHKSIQEEKITDLIDLLLSTNVKNKVEVQKAPEYSVSFLYVITSNFDPSPPLCSIAGQSYDRKVWLPQLRARSGNFVFAWIIRGDLLFLWLPFFIDFLMLMEYANEIFFVN